MNTRHIDENICLEYLTGELPREQKSSFEDHVNVCSDCQSRVEQYRKILRYGLPSIAVVAAEDRETTTLPWSLQEGEKRLYLAIDNEVGPSAGCDRADYCSGSIRLATAREFLRNIVARRTLRVASLVAASLVFTAGLGVSMYRLGLKRGLKESPITRPSQIDPDNLKTQIGLLAREKDAVQATLLERETLIAELRAELKAQRKQAEALEASLRSTSANADEQTRHISSERDDLARKLANQEAALEAAQKRVEALQQAEKNDALRVVTLENQMQQISELAKDREGTIDEQQRLLSADRDIRDLMGARDLYMAEVYDVGGNGKRKKPYGRVFLTKGKSLVFYAYDLDQQPGVKNTSTFQAWGLRGPDRNTALNLGVMYVDNSANKRWVLQFDDSKALDKINAVFVTVEPSGGSRVPRGQQVLFAYLGEEPNHP